MKKRRDPFKPSLAKFRKVIKSIGGHLIMSTDEKVIGILRCTLDSKHNLIYAWAIGKGYMVSEVDTDQRYMAFFYTESGLAIAKEIGENTCITGRKIK